MSNPLPRPIRLRSTGGGTLALTVPIEILKSGSFREGQYFEVRLDENNDIVFHFVLNGYVSKSLEKYNPKLKALKRGKHLCIWPEGCDDIVYNKGVYCLKHRNQLLGITEETN